MQILQIWNVGIVAGAERRAKSHHRFDEALQTTSGISARAERGPLQLQAAGDDSGCASTISVSIHIISSEFQGGGS